MGESFEESRYLHPKKLSYINRFFIAGFLLVMLVIVFPAWFMNKVIGLLK